MIAFLVLYIATAGVARADILPYLFEVNVIHRVGEGFPSVPVYDDGSFTTGLVTGGVFSSTIDLDNGDVVGGTSTVGVEISGGTITSTWAAEHSIGASGFTNTFNQLLASIEVKLYMPDGHEAVWDVDVLNSTPMDFRRGGVTASGPSLFTGYSGAGTAGGTFFRPGPVTFAGNDYYEVFNFWNTENGTWTGKHLWNFVGPTTPEVVSGSAETVLSVVNNTMPSTAVPEPSHLAFGCLLSSAVLFVSGVRRCRNGSVEQASIR
jgi:hypothetical protein